MRTETLRLALTLVAVLAQPAAADCVVLLHGLARTPGSMTPLEEAFAARGFDVANVGYPSRARPIEELAPLAVEEGVARCPQRERIHFVTHSLGGILVRYYLEHHELPRLGRVVMLAPPNQGSEVVDHIRNLPGFALLNGPAGNQLGTDEHSVPRQLGPVNFELGVIAGTETFNPILSLYLPNPDDGKVSVESTRVEGMDDFLIVPHSHTFMMRASAVVEQAVRFIETGAFEHAAPDPHLPPSP